MNQFLEWLHAFLNSWKFWVIVPPWDVGVRVRLGRVGRTLRPGPHLRVPLLDEIHLVNTRQRLLTTPAQTFPGAAGRATRGVSAAIAWRVVDPLAAMQAFLSPDGAVVARSQQLLAERGSYYAGLADDLTLAFGPHGIVIDFAYAVQDIEVRTLRIVGIHDSANGPYSGANQPFADARGVHTY